MPDRDMATAAHYSMITEEERLARIFDELRRRGYDLLWVEIAWSVHKPTRGNAQPFQPLWSICINVQDAPGLIYFRNVDRHVAIEEAERWLASDHSTQQLGSAKRQPQLPDHYSPARP